MLLSCVSFISTEPYGWEGARGWGDLSEQGGDGHVDGEQGGDGHVDGKQGGDGHVDGDDDDDDDDDDDVYGDWFLHKGLQTRPKIGYYGK